MSDDNAIPKTRNSWIIALLISVAVNGLLAGLLISKQVEPASPSAQSLPPIQGSMRAQSNPRHLVRTLSPERRKQVMTTAMRNLKAEGGTHPRKLFKQLRQAKVRTMRLLRADELDTKAIEQSLADIRALNQKLAVSGDALMIEVLAQLTPAERKTAAEALKNRKNRNQSRPR